MASFGAVLVCDDIRRDTNNKDIIIGVYSADIVISSAPNWITISLYFEYLPSDAGEQNFSIRFGMSDAGLIGADIKFRVDELIPVSIPITGIGMLVEKENNLVIEASLDDKKTWQPLKQKKIRIGALPVAAPMPSFSGSTSGNG